MGKLIKAIILGGSTLLSACQNSHKNTIIYTYHHIPLNQALKVNLKSGNKDNRQFFLNNQDMTIALAYANFDKTPNINNGDMMKATTTKQSGAIKIGEISNIKDPDGDGILDLSVEFGSNFPSAAFSVPDSSSKKPKIGDMLYLVLAND